MARPVVNGTGEAAVGCIAARSEGQIDEAICNGKV